MTNQTPNNAPDDNENGNENSGENSGENKNESAGFVRPGSNPNGTDAESEEDKLKKERDAASRRDAIAAATTALVRQQQLEDEENTAYDKTDSNTAQDQTSDQDAPESKQENEQDSVKPEPDAEPQTEETTGEDTLRAEFNRRAVALSNALCKIYKIESVAEPILSELSQTIEIQSESEESFTAKGKDNVMNVSRDQIYAENSGVTPATAYEMVLMGLADPTLRDIGVEVRGNARDRLMLSVMAAKSGLTVLNAPQNIDADMLASVEADIADWVKAKSEAKAEAPPCEKPAAKLPVKRTAPEPGMA